MLIDHGRIREVEAIAGQFQAEMNHRLGIVEAEVTSARPLAESESRSWWRRLTR